MDKNVKVKFYKINLLENILNYSRLNLFLFLKNIY
jgi:hypothetical protein